MLFGSNQMLWSFVLAFPMNNNDTCVIKVSIDVIDWCSTKQNLANALYHSSDCDSIGLLLTSNWFLDSLHFTWNVTVTSLRISMLRLLNNPWLSSSVCTLQRWNNWSFPCTLFFFLKLGKLGGQHCQNSFSISWLLRIFSSLSVSSSLFFKEDNSFWQNCNIPVKFKG